MKATLTLTSRGVVTLPAKLRRALGLRADDQLIAETTPEGLLLRPAVTLPVEIYSEKRIREFDEAEAELALASLQLMGRAYDDELDAFWQSKISSETGGY